VEAELGYSVLEARQNVFIRLVLAPHPTPLSPHHATPVLPHTPKDLKLTGDLKNLGYQQDLKLCVGTHQLVALLAIITLPALVEESYPT
jgi:hypothetical protein